MRKRFLALALLVLLGMAVWTAFSNQGLLGLYRLKQDKARMEARLDQLQSENEKLRVEILRLKSDPAYLEKVAREELGMVRQDEIVFQFKSEPVKAPAQP